MDKDKISCIKTWANAKKQKYNGSVEYKCKAYSVIVCIFYKETHT